MSAASVIPRIGGAVVESDPIAGAALATHEANVTGAHNLTARLAAKTPSVRRFKSGLWYAPGSYTDANVQMTLNKLRAVPFEVGEQQAFDRIGLEIVNPVATSLARLGIYASDADGQPSALIVDAGTIDGASAGSASAKALTIAQTLSEGLVWLAAVAQTAAAWPRIMSGGRSPYIGYPDGATTTALAYQHNADVTGALPATFVQNGLSTFAALVMLRAA